MNEIKMIDIAMSDIREMLIKENKEIDKVLNEVLKATGKYKQEEIIEPFKLWVNAIKEKYNDITRCIETKD